VPARYDLNRDELVEWLGNEPRYRANQIWEGLYQQFAEPADMSSLPKALRTRVEEELRPSLALVTERISEGGDTAKFLWELEGGARIETVLMLYPDRVTVCVSTQAGCAMACGFCATGQAGFTRQLSVGEIVEQVVQSARRGKEAGRRVGNIVFMGMGEPLANEAAVHEAVRRLHDDIGISARHLTVSTVGIVPGIHKLAKWDEPVNLAVSLHAANDSLRDELVPINRQYPIDPLMNACADYLNARGRRLSFEWALIDGVNDRRQDAHELAELCLDLPLPAHVNLIPLNSTPGYPTRGTSPEGVQRFRGELLRLGVNVTVRNNRGNDIDAACGQLAAGQPVAPPKRTRP
jgi:23S rRNA (adenine2503-C2)-methyltransferase